MKKHLLVGIAALLFGSPVMASEPAEFGDFISPVSNPVNFEDPRPTTEVRPLYVYHHLSDSFPIQGSANVVAAQIRVALTERLGFIASKDGYVWLSPQGADGSNGWANIGLGVKYALWRDPETRTMGTLGLRYETSSGDKDVFQGVGDGVLNPFGSALWGVGDFHLLGYIAGRIPLSGNDSTFFDMSLHGDYQVFKSYPVLDRLYPLVEFNWVQTLDGGRRLPINQEGFDFFNLGSRYAGGNGVVTFALGARYRVVDDLDVGGDHVAGIDIGAAYEQPATDRQDLFGWRVTSDVIVWLR